MGGVAAAIAFEVAIFRPWREQHWEGVQQEARADWDRFRAEFEENVREIKRSMGSGRRRQRRSGDGDGDAALDIDEIEQFELAERQRSQAERRAKGEMDRAMGGGKKDAMSGSPQREQSARASGTATATAMAPSSAAAAGEEGGLHRRRAPASAADTGDEDKNASAHSRDTLIDTTDVDGEQEQRRLQEAVRTLGITSSRSNHNNKDADFNDETATADAPQHTLGDATPSTLPASPPWPVRDLSDGHDGGGDFDVMPGESAVLVSGPSSSSSHSNIDRNSHSMVDSSSDHGSRLFVSTTSSHQPDAERESISGFSSSSPHAAPVSPTMSSHDVWSLVDEEEEDEAQRRAFSPLTSPPHYPRTLSPTSDATPSMAGWSDLEMRSPPNALGGGSSSGGDDVPDGFSVIGSGSGDSHGDDDDEHDDDLPGGSGSAVDSGLLIEGISGSSQERGRL